MSGMEVWKETNEKGSLFQVGRNLVVFFYFIGRYFKIFLSGINQSINKEMPCARIDWVRNSVLIQITEIQIPKPKKFVIYWQKQT
jgi:hypothetical protein